MSATDRSYKNARRLRRELSLPEVLLWRRIRGAEPRIRRQHPIGPYVLDFYCAAAKLAIEIDGISHDMAERPSRDQLRDDWLKGQGIDVMRIPAKDVLNDPDEIADSVLRYCVGTTSPLHHSASPSGPPPRARGAGRS